MDQRVVISGIGAITPLGHDAESSFAGLVQGESGVAATGFDLHADSECRIAAEVRNWQGEEILGRRAARRFSRFVHLAVGAARQAAADAKLDDSGEPRERIGVLLGVGLGGLDTLYDSFDRMARGGPRAGSPLDIPALIPNMAAAQVAIDLNARGPCYTIAASCASSAHAIGEAVEKLRQGSLDQVITGGSEAIVTPQGLAGFERLGALSRNNAQPDRACRPFDRDRDGFVLGEGAGVLILERLETARGRGVTPYAEVAGYAATADALHQTQPAADGDGAARAIIGALRAARLPPEAIEYVNAHGTGTLQNDIAETRAIKRAFGSHAANLWISSNKSMIGHLIGAAGAVELIFTALSLKHGIVPPTRNLENPDPECDLDYVPGSARTRRISTAISNSFGFGGHNAVLVLRACS